MPHWPQRGLIYGEEWLENVSTREHLCHRRAQRLFNSISVIDPKRPEPLNI